jgi:23S rRNA U2552 (ribose-2'-O)-methylase RlmE/FtsJ
MTQQIAKQEQKQLPESKRHQKKRIHHQKEHEWYERLKSYFNCHIVGYEQQYPISVNGKRHPFRIDVYGKDINDNEYLVECGDISSLKKQVLEELQKKNPKIRFIHDPYEPNNIEWDIQRSEDICMSAHRSAPELTFKSRFFNGIGKTLVSVLETPESPRRKNHRQELFNRIKIMKQESEKNEIQSQALKKDDRH